MLSLILPTLKTPPSFASHLADLRPFVDEVVIVAADLNDPGIKAIKGTDVHLIPSEKGRGIQLGNGAKAAKGDWFLFLHADTRLQGDWRVKVDRFMADHSDKAGYFQFALDSESKAARALEKKVAWRCRHFALPYGDQGLLISRSHYEALGGFKPLVLMEDVDLVRRIGRARLKGIELKAITSARKFEGQYKIRSARNLLCLSLYFLRFPVKLIQKIYG